MNDNIEVIVQKPNKPETRMLIGYITHGYKPTDDDLYRWGIDRKDIMAERNARIGGRVAYLMVMI